MNLLWTNTLWVSCKCQIKRHKDVSLLPTSCTFSQQTRPTSRAQHIVVVVASIVCQFKLLICVMVLFPSSYQAYLIACVWNCYRYVTGRGSSEILLYVTTNDTTVSQLGWSILSRPTSSVSYCFVGHPPCGITWLQCFSAKQCKLRRNYAKYSKKC